MTEIELLYSQTEAAHEWTRKLLSPIPQDSWEIVPDQILTSVSWQAGHLTISEVYHCIICIHGAPKELFGTIDMRTMSQLFGIGSDPARAAGAIPPSALAERLELVQLRVLDAIRALNEEQLDQPLEPLKRPHPVANTKREAINWNIQHIMWHCGQIAMLRRYFKEPMQFIA